MGGGGGLATFPLCLKGKGSGMATSPFCLKGNGNYDGMATSPFYLKGMVIATYPCSLKSDGEGCHNLVRVKVRI